MTTGCSFSAARYGALAMASSGAVEEDRAFRHINRHWARATAWIINPLAAAEVLRFPSTATSTNVNP